MVNVEDQSGDMSVYELVKELNGQHGCMSSYDSHDDGVEVVVVCKSTPEGGFKALDALAGSGVTNKCGRSLASFYNTWPKLESAPTFDYFKKRFWDAHFLSAAFDASGSDEALMVLLLAKVMPSNSPVIPEPPVHVRGHPLKNMGGVQRVHIELIAKDKGADSKYVDECAQALYKQVLETFSDKKDILVTLDALNDKLETVYAQERPAYGFKTACKVSGPEAPDDGPRASRSIADAQGATCRPVKAPRQFLPFMIRYIKGGPGDANGEAQEASSASSAPAAPAPASPAPAPASSASSAPAAPAPVSPAPAPASPASSAPAAPAPASPASSAPASKRQREAADDDDSPKRAKVGAAAAWVGSTSSTGATMAGSTSTPPSEPVRSLTPPRDAAPPHRHPLPTTHHARHARSYTAHSYWSTICAIRYIQIKYKHI